MKTHILVALVGFLTLTAAAHPFATPAGSAFTYQGQLKQAGEPVDDTADFEFRVFDVPSGGAALVAMVPVNGLLVEQGQFTVELDFGAGIFGSDARWLEIAVRSPAASGTFETLTPRQRIRPAPVAQYALTADGASVSNLNASNITSGVIANAQTTGSASNAANSLVLRDANGNFAANTVTATGFSGSGAALTNLNASSLTSGVLPSSALSGIYSGAVSFTNAGNTFAGNFSGSGAGLTNLNASNITTGTLDESRLPSSLLDRIPDLTVAPTLVGSIPTGSNPYGIAVSGNLAYVTTLFGLLQIFDVSNPGNPSLTGSISTGFSQATSVAVSGNLAYVTHYNPFTLRVIDVTSPASPVSVGSAPAGANPNSLIVSGNHAYVLCGSGLLQVFNLSNPLSPSLAGSLACAGGFDGAVSGNHYYVAGSQDNVLQIIDVTNPASPALAGSISTGQRPMSVAVTGNYAYVVCQNTKTLEIYDVSNPSSPSVAGITNLGNFPTTILVQDGYAHVTYSAFSSPLDSFHLATPTSPVLAHSIGITGNIPNMAESDGYLYLPSQTGAVLQIIHRQGLEFTQHLVSSAFSGSGAGLTLLNASNLSSGTIANSRTTGTSSSTASTLVMRDTSGNFSANSIFVNDTMSAETMSAQTMSAGTLELFAGNPRLELRGVLGSGQAGELAGIDFYNGGVPVLASSITCIKQNPLFPDHALAFTTTSSNPTTTTEKMRLTSAGNLGIGTTTPVHKLELEGLNQAAATSGSSANGIARLGPTGSTATLDIGVQGSPAHAWIQSRDASSYATDFNLALNPNGGNVGIGTIAPTTALDVNGTMSAEGLLVSGVEGAYVGDGSTARTWIGAASNANYIQSGNAAWSASRILHFTGFNASEGTFAFNGDVGIGAAPSSDRLTVFDSSGSTNLKVETTTSGISSLKLFEAGNFGYEFEYDGSGATDRLRLWSRGFAGNEAVRMTWTKDGRVGIGRDPASNALEVEGGASKTTAGGFIANSDRRIKTAVRDLDDALSIINQVRPVAFRYTPEYIAAHPTIEDVEYYNVIAQEFAQVFPDSVKDSGEKLPNGDSILQVDVHPMFIQTVAAVQQLHEIVQEKDAEIASLNDRVAQLERLMRDVLANQLQNGGSQ